MKPPQTALADAVAAQLDLKPAVAMPTDQEDTDHDLMSPAELVRASGVLESIRTTSFTIQMRQLCCEQGMELLQISHRRHPVVEAVLYVGEQTPELSLRLRSKLYRLFLKTGFRVPKEQLFVRFRRSVVRIACVPTWE